MTTRMPATVNTPRDPFGSRLRTSLSVSGSTDGASLSDGAAEPQWLQVTAAASMRSAQTGQTFMLEATIQTPGLCAQGDRRTGRPRRDTIHGCHRPRAG